MMRVFVRYPNVANRYPSTAHKNVNDDMGRDKC